MTARPIRRNAQTPDRNGKIFYTSTTSLSHISKYSRFVAMIRQQMSGELPFEEAVERAVDTCIRQGILSEILRKNRSEVIDMILTEYNEEEFSLSEGEAEQYVKKVLDNLDE